MELCSPERKKKMKPSPTAERYARQIAMAEIGTGGQEKLPASKVLVIGAGGLGSPAALHLAAAGVGTLGLVDHDRVEPSNLQRQIAHFTPDIGCPKVESAAEKLRALNPDVKVETWPRRFDASSAAEVLREYDFVIDATDNFASKFFIADACHFALKPYVHAGILRFWGQAITVLPGQTCCYRCIFRDSAQDPENPEGPLGAVPGVIGSIQATEAVKFLLGRGDLLTNRLLTYDALAMRFRVIPANRSEECPLCGDVCTIPSPFEGQEAPPKMRI